MTDRKRRPALFLDRDGVINLDHGYVSQRSDFVFVDGIFDLCKEATGRHIPIIIVTNQAGIGRGYYDEATFHALMNWVSEQFATQDIPISGIYFCPYHPQHGIGIYRQESDRRKPGPGMLLDAARDHDLDLENSIIIGDKMSDCIAGFRAGLRHTILLQHAGGKQDMMPDPGMPQPLHVHSLAEARQAIRTFWQQPDQA